MEPLLANLRRFTRSFSRDVSAYRSVIHTAAEQAKELAGSPATPAAQTDGSALLLLRIMEANEHLQKRLDEAETSLHSQSQQLHTYMTEARTDLLTGLANRRAFDEELSKRLALLQRQGVPLGVMLVDVDHFKSVNDRYGHAAGDLVLKRVAEALDRAARETDLVARYGGEEFGVAVAGATLEEFGKAADRLRRAVQALEVRTEQGIITPTVSCGITQVQPAEQLAATLERADEALYAAKRGGRNCAFVHDGQRSWKVTAALTGSGAAGENSLPQSERFLNICQELRRKITELSQ
jgi:diguanylate cyclase